MAKIVFTNPMRRDDGLYSVQLFINGISSGYSVEKTPTKAKSAARLLLRDLKRYQTTKAILDALLEANGGK